ncbi:MAG: hypothetical protein COA94_01425 [Rickettsiales bacterium]|nr:MAG: hypothetical protein COA94_01425 [Rickettsiales bacterium]
MKKMFAGLLFVVTCVFSMSSVLAGDVVDSTGKERKAIFKSKAKESVQAGSKARSVVFPCKIKNKLLVKTKHPVINHKKEEEDDEFSEDKKLDELNSEEETKAKTKANTQVKGKTKPKITTKTTTKIKTAKAEPEATK